jgi:hypothetical protein
LYAKRSEWEPGIQINKTTTKKKMVRFKRCERKPPAMVKTQVTETTKVTHPISRSCTTNDVIAFTVHTEETRQSARHLNDVNMNNCIRNHKSNESPIEHPRRAMLEPKVVRHRTGNVLCAGNDEDDSALIVIADDGNVCNGTLGPFAALEPILLPQYSQPNDHECKVDYEHTQCGGKRVCAKETRWWTFAAEFLFPVSKWQTEGHCDHPEPLHNTKSSQGEEKKLIS